jgi:hypothetical protein
MRPAEVLVAPDPDQTVSGDSYTNRENCYTPQLEPKTAALLVKIVDRDRGSYGKVLKHHGYAQMPSDRVLSVNA